jgi:gluconolactonase
MGPGGKVYLCNNGARFTEASMEGLTFPGGCTPERYIGGRIQTVDIDTGEVTDLYTECDGQPLWAPNDLVFDSDGGFYFTDHGLEETEKRIHHVSSIFYAKSDGSKITEIEHPARDPNGIGLSPDGTKLYWAETWNGRIQQRDIVAPGQLAEVGVLDTSQCLYGFPGLQLLDSLGVDSDGNVCVATLVNGGVSVVSPAGELIDFVGTDDPLTTNVTFGGPDLRTAFITLSGTGKLVKTDWPRPGVKLNHLDT